MIPSHPHEFKTDNTDRIPELYAWVATLPGDSIYIPNVNESVLQVLENFHRAKKQGGMGWNASICFNREEDCVYALLRFS